MKFKQMLQANKDYRHKNEYELVPFLINDGLNYKRKDFAKEDIIEDLYYRFMKTEYDLTQDDLREFIYYDIQDRRTNQEM